MTQLTADANCECDAAYSPDGIKIAYIRETNGQGDIWIMDSDGTNQRQLTKDRGEEGGPRFLPDGSQIVFWRTDLRLQNRWGHARAREIYLVDVLTGAETRLTNNDKEDVFPAFSPDGKKIALMRDGQLWITSDSGANPVLLGSGSESDFSRDSSQVVTAAGQYSRQIDVVNIDRSQRRTIYSKNTRVSHPVFSPDGSAVYFLEESAPGGVGTLIRVLLDGGAVTPLVRTF